MIIIMSGLVKLIELVCVKGLIALKRNYELRVLFCYPNLLTKI